MTENTNPPLDKIEATTFPKRVRQAPTSAMPLTKTAQMSKLLARTRGATIAELGAATGWQPHSVRALLSGLRKKGVRLAKETRKSGEGCYRIERDNAVAAADSEVTVSPIVGAAAATDGA